MEINSKEWWENEFKNNWRVGIDGVEQTRYFMKRILETVKLDKGTSALDWGCAMGQGVDELNKIGINAEGYDFAEKAINAAKEMYPEYNFYSETPSKQYDTVISSNCFEHFEDPIFWLKEVFKLSKEYLIIMTPYNQIPNKMHPTTITEKTFPEEINGFRIIETRIVPSKEAFYDGGDQILFIYKKYQ